MHLYWTLWSCHVVFGQTGGWFCLFLPCRDKLLPFPELGKPRGQGVRFRAAQITGNAHTITNAFHTAGAELILQLTQPVLLQNKFQPAGTSDPANPQRSLRGILLICPCVSMLLFFFYRAHRLESCPALWKVSPVKSTFPYRSWIWGANPSLNRYKLGGESDRLGLNWEHKKATSTFNIHTTTSGSLWQVKSEHLAHRLETAAKEIGRTLDGLWLILSWSKEAWLCMQGSL